MMKRAIAIIFCFLLFANIAAAAEPQKLNIIKPEKGTAKTFDAAKPIISLVQAKQNSKALDNQSMTVNPGTINNTFVNSSQPEPKKETVTSNSVGSGMVSDGINLFGRSLIDGMYASFDNNKDVNNKFGTVRGSLYTAITYVPNPYDDPAIKGLFKNYNALAIFFVCIFIFGEWANRSLARTKIYSSVFDEKDLSTSRFWGGLCMCFIALAANFFYVMLLKIIETLSQFVMMNNLSSIAPSPENLVLYAMMAICDITVAIFFIIRYFIIYAMAVLCTLIAVMYVPEWSRDFAKKTTDHVLRILFLQPVAIFFTGIGIMALKGLPSNSGMQAIGYVCLTILVFLICWYMLFGDFEFIKKGVKLVTAAGLV